MHIITLCSHCEESGYGAHVPAAEGALGALHVVPDLRRGVIFKLIVWLYLQPQATHL